MSVTHTNNHYTSIGLQCRAREGEEREPTAAPATAAGAAAASGWPAERL